MRNRLRVHWLKSYRLLRRDGHGALAAFATIRQCVSGDAYALALLFLAFTRRYTNQGNPLP